MIALALSIALCSTPQKLAFNPVVDLSVTGGLAAAWLTAELALKKPLAPQACRWCETNGFDNAIRSVFHPAMSPSANGNPSADMWSNVFGYGITPLGILGLDALVATADGAFVEAWPVDLTIIAEASLAAITFNQIVKFAAGRSRPYAVGADVAMLKDVADSNLSFFSGHTTFAFALATSAGTVASLRDYRYAWAVWAGAMPLALVSGILRIAADKHWASDVLVGMGAGALFGVGIPLLFHGRVQAFESLRVAPTGNGIMASGRF